MKLSNTRIAYGVLIALTILLVLIYIFHNRKELFTDAISIQSSNSAKNPIVNLPANDIHFISDNNPKLINTVILNYKLMVNLDSGNSIPTPAITNSSKPSNTSMNAIQTNPLIDSLIDSKQQANINLASPDNKTLKYLSVFQHKPFNTYKGLGQYVILTDQPFKNADVAVQSVLDKKCLCLNYLTSSPITPAGYNLIWTSDLNADGQIFSVWHPIPPAGCIALGDVIVIGTEQPSNDLVACFPITMLDKTALSNGMIWKSINDMGKQCYCWGAGNIDTFRATNIYSPDMSDLQSVYNLPMNLLQNNILTPGSSSSANRATSDNSNTLNSVVKSTSGGITI